jgi:hypothetical protein
MSEQVASRLRRVTLSERAVEFIKARGGVIRIAEQVYLVG